MKRNLSKSGLAIFLSKLEVFDKPNVRVEQYPMDPEIGAEVLWNAYLQGDIEGKVIVDLGCGTGILGIGALLLGAKRVFFADNDKNALKIAKNNLFLAKSESSFRKKAVFLCMDVKDFRERCDVVLQNPPFGVKKRGMDRVFLGVAFRVGDVIYSFHKLNTSEFIEKFAESESFRITHLWKFNFPLKASLFFHKKRIYRVRVGCFRFVKG